MFSVASLCNVAKVVGSLLLPPPPLVVVVVFLQTRCFVDCRKDDVFASSASRKIESARAAEAATVVATKIQRPPCESVTPIKTLTVLAFVCARAPQKQPPPPLALHSRK